MVHELMPSFSLRISSILDLPPVNAAPVGIGLALGDYALEIVLLHRSHERLAAPLDRHSFGDQMIGAAPQQPLEASLTLDKRQRAQILAIQPEQVEGNETCRA